MGVAPKQPCFTYCSDCGGSGISQYILDLIVVLGTAVAVGMHDNLGKDLMNALSWNFEPPKPGCVIFSKVCVFWLKLWGCMVIDVASWGSGGVLKESVRLSSDSHLWISELSQLASSTMSFMILYKLFADPGGDLMPSHCGSVGTSSRRYQSWSEYQFVRGVLVLSLCFFKFKSESFRELGVSGAVHRTGSHFSVSSISQHVA